MANVQILLAELGDFSNILTRVEFTPQPAIPELDTIREWDDRSGLPIFPDPNEPWRRFIPNLLLSSLAADTDTGIQFINGMRGNVEGFFVEAGGKGNTTKKQILKKINKSDFKRITVTNVHRGLQVQKNNAVLTPFNGHPPSLVTGTKGIEELIAAINANAGMGTDGPGTFPCRQPHCTYTGPCITSSRTVRWGPGENQIVHLRKRFNCAATNVVYLIHCNACIEEGNWTTYVGERDPEDSEDHIRYMHHRISHHLGQTCRFNVQQMFGRNPSADSGYLDRVIGILGPERDPDPDRLMQDTFSHFNFKHTRGDRRLAILDGGFPHITTRRHHETFYQLQFGNFQYYPATHSGSLNIF